MDFIKNIYSKSIAVLRDEKGQTIVEYALIIVLLVLVVLVAMMGIGQNINNSFSTINSAFN
jgi:pilus assembly protein Flp/PilA